MKISQDVFNLANDVLKFPFDDCDEHDFLDRQEEHVWAYIQIVDRFLSCVKRIPDDALQADVRSVNTNIRHMWAAKALRTQVMTVIDHLNELAAKPDSGFYRVEDTMFEQYFESQKVEILNAISSASFCIWVAVAWFTDKELADALISKAREGLNVRVVMNNDRINDYIGRYLEGKVELIAADPERRLMHHKFCIVDLKLVLHGSFNWTKRANSNNETLSLNRSAKLAEEFSQEFVQLVHQCKCV
ncbi:TPA: hypothetical protein GRR81_25270 [Vibrio parahaemolyticus]|uniref:phospholipase D-like domain-containing protein n=1 Tax=Vibrio parahaemolyticus TaxID=670 RepID=UPI001A28C169|nr:hypothetical protein [Vibrio parahaemolyticus]MCF9331757.1 hypothetical protein [Vibrio parahaemolyticus]HAS6444361.1 hypothetical protein [Vibrio parahaemolyticus]